MTTKTKTAQAAKAIWLKYRRGGSPTKRERQVLRNAYWMGVLPKDADYCVEEWVEVGFPQIVAPGR